MTRFYYHLAFICVTNYKSLSIWFKTAIYDMLNNIKMLFMETKHISSHMMTPILQIEYI